MKKYIAILMVLALFLFVVACDDDKTRTGEDDIDSTHCGCFANYVPVCSTEEVTYDNECFAECDGAEVAYEGVCLSDLTACGGINHTGCPEGYNCNVSLAAGKTDEGYCFEEDTAIGCGIEGITHYVKKDIIYHMDDKGRSYVDIVAGTYIWKEDQSGWTFTPYMNRESSYYNTTMTSIESGITTWGAEVECTEANNIPVGFSVFFETHPVK